MTRSYRAITCGLSCFQPIDVTKLATVVFFFSSFFHSKSLSSRLGRQAEVKALKALRARAKYTPRQAIREHCNLDGPESFF